MSITIIAAITKNNALGIKGDLLYHISNDLKRFKTLTMGHPIIMGRKTFESFPKGALPGRRNIVVSRNPHYSAAGAEVYTSLNEAVGAVAANEEAFIIGGGEIYRQAMPIADRLELTVIDAERNDADTYFPDIDTAVWEVVAEGQNEHDERSNVDYRFVAMSHK